jgi:putative SOS response-associated peptidase YedK
MPCSRAGTGAKTVCNLYSVTTNQEAIRRLFRVGRDLTGNLPPLPGIFPDYISPVIRVSQDGERELTMMRWGMPCPPQFGGAHVTNIRNTKSPHWRRWLGPACRVIVPFTSFCEYADTKPRKTPTRSRARRLHEAAQDADLVRAGREPATDLLRRDLLHLDGHPRHKGEPGRGRA